MSVSRRDQRWPHLACSMDAIVSKFALLEAEFLLRRSVTIVRGTSVINYSRTTFDDTEYVYQCMIGSPSEAG